MAAVYAERPRTLLPGSECMPVTVWICERCGWAMPVLPTRPVTEATIRRIRHLALAHHTLAGPGREVGWWYVRSPHQERRGAGVAPSA